MSDQSKVDEILAGVAKSAAEETRKQEVLAKELLVRERKVDLVLEKQQKNDEELEKAKLVDYGFMSDAEIEKKIQDNTEYLTAARNKLPFINSIFEKSVPFFRKNLILVGAPTGSGKSTTVANIILGLLSIKSKQTGKLARVLVITNEEKTEDVFNRITCLLNGWAYTNHDRFTEEQMVQFNKQMPILRRIMTVIDDNHEGIEGTTTTLEGISGIFDNLLKSKEHYDAVIIDYYQNCNESKRNPMLSEFQVQSLFASRLNKYKDVFPAPIVVMAQVRDVDTQNTPFKIRIEGTKKVLNFATCAIEMKAHPKDKATSWTVHKSRFNEGIGDVLWTGYKDGKYVVRDEAFMADVDKWKAKQEQNELDRKIFLVAPQAEEGEDK